MRTRISVLACICSSRLLLLAAVAMLTAGFISAQVAPTTIFQLDGKPTNDNLSCTYGMPCDYWNLLNGAGGANVTQNQTPPTAAGNWNVRTFLNGLTSTSAFTGGGSKDPNLISQWAYTTGSAPNKDTLNGAYAAAYEIGGHFELIFGADRASPSGDANIGIWFFQQQVGPNGSGGFTGAHMDHDVFIISAFTGGGGTSTVSAYEWDHTCASGVKNPTAGQCADTNLRELAAPSGVCGTSIYCAITNSATVNSSWEGSLAAPLFFEGGIDLTAALAAAGVTTLPCFSSFLVETRSSQSTTAVLKDFLAGGFPVCGLANGPKACGTTSIANSGTATTFPVTGSVKNTGIGVLYDAQVTDMLTYTVQGATTATVVTHGPILVSNTNSSSPYYKTATLGPNDTGAWSDSVTADTASVSDVASGEAATSEGGTLTVMTDPKAPATATCSTSYTGALNVTKSCTTGLQVAGSSVEVVISYNGTVYNNSPSELTGVTLVDVPDFGTQQTFNIGTLVGCTAFDGSGNCTTPGSSATYSSTYVPTNFDKVLGTGAGLYSWGDEIDVTKATAVLAGTTLSTTTAPDKNTVYAYGTASCPICPLGACPTM